MELIVPMPAVLTTPSSGALEHVRPMAPQPIAVE
jgi:hypothetical protein